MLTEEDIESWNTFFTNGKVKETDLQQPTEEFLVRAFVAYLQAFGYKVDLTPFVANNAREKRLFMIRLAQNVDHMLKFTEKSYEFFYYDLIKPGPKKTSKVLSILLNYYAFYIMFKSEIFELANGAKAHKEIFHKIQETQKENQERKERAKQIAEEITKISKTIPITKAELDALVAKKNNQQEQIRKLQDSIEDLNKKINHLRTQKRNLRKQIVDDNEALKLKSELTDLQTNIEENLLKKNDLEKTLNERMEVIKNLKNLMICLDEAKNISLLPHLEEYKELTKKLKQSKIDHEDKSQKKQALLGLIAKQEDELKNMEEKFKMKQHQFEQEKAEKLKSILQKEALCSSAQLESKNLKNQLQQCNNLLEERKKMRIFLKDAVSEILSRYDVELKCIKF